jgi:hypothetical protein
VRNCCHSDDSRVSEYECTQPPPVGVPQFLLYGHRKAQEAKNRGGGVSSSSGAYGDRRGALAFGYFAMGEGGERRG